MRSDESGRTERLQKVLAAAGLGSRRACERLISDGRVTVNGEPVMTLPVIVDPLRDRIAVDGKLLRPERKVYFVLNKPPGVVCTNADPSGRKRAVDLLAGVRERVFAVGRLDAESSGLLLMTNDGEFALRMTHPRFGVAKTYRAEVAGRLEESAIARVREGVWLSEGKTSPAKIRVVHRQPKSTIVEITLREGRNREVRRIFAKLGHKVYRLHRVMIGPVSLRGLPMGAFRVLRPEEVASLRRAAQSVSPPPWSIRRHTWPRHRGAVRRSGRGRDSGRDGRGNR